MKDIYFLLTPRYLALDECLSLHRIASRRPGGSALGY